MKEPIKEFSVKFLNDQLKEHHISLAFQGIFSQDVLTLIGANLRSLPNNKAISKKLFALVIEMAQNIHHYSAAKSFSKDHGRDIGEGILAVGESEEHFVVCSGNFVGREDKQEIESRFGQINNMTEQELKEAYAVQRRKPQRADKPGASLGLIDMRRKSGHPLEFTFTEVSSKESFFILKATVSKDLPKTGANRN